ncbi:DUF7344 domain-containing protein [Natronolimnohabitans innermongolicus]|uniref:DUF7344 domain-containing protein n=1 Tax=Natronolimnohabitans innermongolicus TaxID=253107 RepID=UPI00067789D1|nr:hypothetical protein [Natronolimnohabitans innermongolicus]
MRFTTPTRLGHEREGLGEATAIIVAMGIALSVAGIVRTLSIPASQPVLAFELFVSLLVPTGLATGGYWLANRDVSRDVRWQVATRVSIGIVVACALGIWLIAYIALEGGTIHDPLSLTTTLAAVGGATGFVTAVREEPDVVSPGPVGPDRDSSSDDESADSEGESDANGHDHAAATVSEVARPKEGRGTELTVERPTAAAATAATAAPTGTVTSATEREPSTATIDVVATSDVTAAAEGESTQSGRGPSSSPSRSPEPTTDDTSPSANASGSSTAVWQDTDPAGRTAAPAQPAHPAAREAFAEFDAGDDDTVETEADRPDADSVVPAPEPGLEAATDVPSTVESTLEVLAAERARLALAVLYHEWDDGARPVDELARDVSAHTDADTDADAVAVALRHTTLPALQDLRAVDWEPYADRVSAPEHAVFEEGVREASVLLESFEPGTR